MRAYFHALHQRLDSEFKAISKSQSTSSTVIQTLVSGGGGGNTPTTKPAFVVTQTVSAAGSVTVNFPNTGVVTYSPICMFLSTVAPNSIQFLVPDIAPNTESRTGSSFTVTAQEAGVLISFVVFQ
jgi:hypothetical protein